MSGNLQRCSGNPSEQVDLLEKATVNHINRRKPPEKVSRIAGALDPSHHPSPIPLKGDIVSWTESASSTLKFPSTGPKWRLYCTMPAGPVGQYDQLMRD